MQEAFKHYLNEIETIENVETFEIDVYDSSKLIEDIFLNLDEINKLFEYKFNFKLFIPPVAAQTMLNRAIGGKEIRFTDFVATIGSIIDSIDYKEINKLSSSSAQINGSINKILSLLKEENINYDVKTIETLRALYNLRNTTFPIHEAGSKNIKYLQKVNIDYPIEDYKDAPAKMLQSLNSCLLEMKLWFK
jgi:hypothetical protein